MYVVALSYDFTNLLKAIDNFKTNNPKLYDQNSKSFEKFFNVIKNESFQHKILVSIASLINTLYEILQMNLPDVSKHLIANKHEVNEVYDLIDKKFKNLKEISEWISVNSTNDTIKSKATKLIKQLDFAIEKTNDAINKRKNKS